MADQNPPEDVLQCKGRRYRTLAGETRCAEVQWNDVIDGWSLIFKTKFGVVHLPFQVIIDEPERVTNEPPSDIQIASWTR